MLVFKTNFATVDLDERKRLIALTWLRQPSIAEFKEAFMTALEAAKNYKVLFFLADNSIGINVDVSAQRWVSVIAAQEFKELYLKSYARVVPKDAIQEIISQKVYNYFQELVPNQMQFETFYTLAEARDWLQVQERVENSKL